MDAWYFGGDELTALKNVKQTPSVFAEHLLRDGYVVLKQSISADTIEQVIDDYSKFKDRVAPHNPPHYHGKYRRIINLHCALPSLFRLFHENKAALETLDFFFQEPAELYTSLFYEIGSGQEQHRDTPYFWTNPGYKYFGVWVALEDVDKDNGCLQVIPKSHLLPEEDRDIIAKKYYSDPVEIPSSDNQLWIDYQSMALSRALKCGLTVVDVEVKKGDTIIWHPHTLHGGRPIVDSSRTRLSFVMHATPPKQAVFHHQGFFNSQATLATHSPYDVTMVGGRSYRNYPTISFEHQLELSIENVRV